MRSKLTCVLVMMFMLCGLGLAQQNPFNVQYLQTNGGTMTGPIQGKTNFEDPIFGSVTGGLPLTDAHGNMIHMGLASGSDFMLISTGDYDAALLMQGGSSPSIGLGLLGQGFDVAKGTGITLNPGKGQTTYLNGLSGVGKVSAFLQTFANNEAALAGGLVAGNLYRLGTNPDLLAVVH